jgi:hypothetical protein
MEYATRDHGGLDHGEFIFTDSGWHQRVSWGCS